MSKEEKLVFESDDKNVGVNENVNTSVIDDENVPMSNGENCGIVEFEGKRINTCKGEQIREDGYRNPDNRRD